MALLLPDPAAHLQSVQTRQHQVQDHQIGPYGARPRHGRQAVGDLVHGETGTVQIARDDLRDGRIVVHDEDAGLGLCDRCAHVVESRTAGVPGRPAAVDVRVS